jgi:predicted cobalt transporter CbtA
MNPARYGRYAVALITHKLCRWLVPLTVPGAVLGLALLAPSSSLARLALAGVVVVVALGVAGMRWPETRGRVPAVLSMPGFLVASMTAGLLAWGRALRGQSNAVWEPTRRAVPVTTNHPA